MTHSSGALVLPVRSSFHSTCSTPDMYAIQRPSGDQRGFAVVLRNVVNKRRPLPSAPIVAIAPG
jgi:hypothetical protein